MSHKSLLYIVTYMIKDINTANGLAVSVQSTMVSAVPLKPSASRHVFPQLHLRHAEEAHSTFAKEETQDETTLQVRDGRCTGAHRCTVLCTIHLLKGHLEALAHRSDVDGILQVSVLTDSHRFT